MPKDENKKTVRQKDADELHTTTTPDPASPPTIVEQSDPAKLKATVTQAAKDRTVTGNVGILDSLDARINPAKEDGNLASIVTQLDITLSSFRDALRGANTKDFSTIQTVLDSIKNTDGIKKITDTVTVTATDLDIRDLSKAQDELYAVLRTDAGVAYDARDRSWTITENVPVTGTFWQATQPVSGTFWQATQPVSGTVTANAGTNLNTSGLLTENDFDTRIGEVQIAPTAYTVLSRLKSIADGQLADGHNVTVDNASIPVTGTFWQATQPVSGTFWQATQPVSGTVTVTDISDIKTAVQKIDNQEDSITYVHVPKANVDGDIIVSPGVGFFLRIHHIYVSNEGANFTIFEIEDAVTPKWRFPLAAEGGVVAQNLKRPWDLAQNAPLHYDYISGALAAINITIGYETIAV